MTCKNQKSNTHHQVHRQTRSERSPAAVIRARQKARGASRGGPREPQAWVEGRKTTASPGFCGKETFIATCFLKCLRLETHILSHLPCATLVALLRVLPAPTSSTGSSEAGVAGGQLLSVGCSGLSGAPLKTLADKTIQHLWSVTLVRWRPSEACLFLKQLALTC